MIDEDWRIDCRRLTLNNILNAKSFLDVNLRQSIRQSSLSLSSRQPLPSLFGEGSGERLLSFDELLPVFVPLPLPDEIAIYCAEKAI